LPYESLKILKAENDEITEQSAQKNYHGRGLENVTCNRKTVFFGYDIIQKDKKYISYIRLTLN